MHSHSSESNGQGIDQWLKSEPGDERDPTRHTVCHQLQTAMQYIGEARQRRYGQGVDGYSAPANSLILFIHWFIDNGLPCGWSGHSRFVIQLHWKPHTGNLLVKSQNILLFLKLKIWRTRRMGLTDTHVNHQFRDLENSVANNSIAFEFKITLQNCVSGARIRKYI